MRTCRFEGALQDGLFLSVVVGLSLVLYVGDLGFYSDDWSVLARFITSPDASFAGPPQSEYPPLLYRPVHLLYGSALYWSFGAEPLGYHLVNAGVLSAGVVLLYLVLRELRQKRVVALGSALIYALLPHYSTERFWPAAFQATLSMCLCFLSFYACLRALRSGRPHVSGWGFLCILSLLGSALAYEIFMPFFLLIPLLVWHRRPECHGSARGKSLAGARFWALPGSAVIALSFAAIWKMATVSRARFYDRTESLGANLDRAADHLLAIGQRLFSLDYGDHDYGLNIVRAIQTNYGDYGLGLPRTTWELLRAYPDPLILLGGAAVGAVIFLYLQRTTRTESTWPGPVAMLPLTALGVILFGLGYAVFLMDFSVQFTLAGIGNRTAIAAAVGVALSMVGAIGYLSGHLPSVPWRRHAFCALVALIGACGFLINNTLATFWIEAYQREKQVLADVREQFPSLPPGSALILDGVCPYVGPAIVFESGWDLAGALQTKYLDSTLRADVVTPRLRVDKSGLSTRIYDGIDYTYPYDESLFVYHFRQKTAHPLADVEAAYRYFRKYNPDLTGGCPEGHEGHGVPIF